MANKIARARFFVKRAARKQLLGVLTARKESMGMPKKKREVKTRALWRGLVPQDGYGRRTNLVGEREPLWLDVRLVMGSFPDPDDGDVPRLIVEKAGKDATGGDQWTGFKPGEGVFERIVAEALDELETALREKVVDLDKRTTKAMKVTKGLLKAKRTVRPHLVVLGLPRPVRVHRAGGTRCGSRAARSSSSRRSRGRGC